jgi:sugar/nucleoside kinase (ribokinase family)
MSHETRRAPVPPRAVGAGLVVLDVILDNGTEKPIFRAGGTCGNVLAGLSFLGWRTTAISRAGNDLAGRILLQDLSRDGVNVRHVTVEDGVSTPRIVERLNSYGQNAVHRFLLRCPTCGAHLPRFRSPTVDFVEGLNATHRAPQVYFFDKVTPATLRLARAYREAGALIFLEPSRLKQNDELKAAIRLCHVLKYSSSQETRGAMAVDASDNMETVEPQGPILTIRTMGERGLSFRSLDPGQWHYRDGFRIRRLYDPCGAGDWCTVGFLFRLHEVAQERKITLTEALQSRSLVDSSLRFAQMLSSLSCVFVGARGLSGAMDRMDVLRTVRMRLEDGADASAVAGSYWTKDRSGPIQVWKEVDQSTLCQTCLLPRRGHCR